MKRNPKVFTERMYRVTRASILVELQVIRSEIAELHVAEERALTDVQRLELEWIEKRSDL